MPDERYFSMPSAEDGGDVRRKRALNCWPWVRSLTQSPEAVIHSPAAMVAAWPTTVTTSRCPRTLARSTQKPFSTLWYVTRSAALFYDPETGGTSSQQHRSTSRLAWRCCGQHRQQH